MNRFTIRGAAFVLGALGLVSAISGCSTEAPDDGSSEAAATEATDGSLYNAGNRFSGWGGHDDHYLDEVQPILAKRCVTCHGCTSAPCQLKLTSFEGVKRGANKSNVFGTTILSASTGLTRMKDGVTDADWKRKGFYSVVEGGKDSSMYKLLTHGKEGNTEGFDLTNPFALYKDKVEVLAFEVLDTPAAVDKRIAKPGTGMPFGISGMAPSEYDTLTAWIEQGAKGPSPEAQKILETARDPAIVTVWEDFFNQSTPKAKLSMRYIFEHVAFGKIHFDESTRGRGDFFDLVRATTRTGPIKELVTETNNGDTGAPFFYRLKKHTQIITAKDNTVFHLTERVKSRWEELFLTSQWEPGALPDYSNANPFVYFDAIPGQIRYQFMLENSHRLIDAMVKSDVCTGAAATYAIRDRFFTLFLDPKSDPTAIDPKLGQTSYAHLDPTASSATSPIRDRSFASLFQTALKKLKPQGFTEKDLWDGNKTDKNAWVTVFRHGTNASAHQGPMGQYPETMWVLDYGNFERLFYDLVVLYRPWGPAAPKIATWTTMSQVRAHGEDLFLMFLPEQYRDSLRLAFTPGVSRFTETPMTGAGFPSGLQNIDAQHPGEDFVSRVRKYLGPVIAPTDDLEPDPMLPPVAVPAGPLADRASLEVALHSLTLDRGKFSDALPEITWVTIEAGDQTYDYTLLANRIYWSNSRLIGNFLSGLNRRPELDSISVVRGHVGSFPELFLRVPMQDVPLAVMAGRGTTAQRMQIRAKYEVKRNSPEFWKYLDNEHAKQLKEHPLDSGIIDVREYLWPAELQVKQKEPVR